MSTGRNVKMSRERQTVTKQQFKLNRKAHDLKNPFKNRLTGGHFGIVGEYRRES